MARLAVLFLLVLLEDRLSAWRLVNEISHDLLRSWIEYMKYIVMHERVARFSDESYHAKTT